MTEFVPGPLPLANTVPVIAYPGERVLTPEQWERLRREGDPR